MRHYQRVSDETRAELIECLSFGLSIKESAHITGVNYENAKAIRKTFRNKLNTMAVKGKFQIQTGRQQRNKHGKPGQHHNAITAFDSEAALMQRMQ